jgi:H+/Cl- antiporter ClcA
LQYDKPLIAAAMGALSTIPAEIISRILLFSGIGKYSIYQLDSLLITFNRPNEFLGFYLNGIIGGIVGIAFYYSIKFLGEDYLVYKSIFVGLLASALSELLITALIEGKYIEIRPIGDYFLHIISAMIFGLTLGILFNKYLFNKPHQA